MNKSLVLIGLFIPLIATSQLGKVETIVLESKSLESNKIDIQSRRNVLIYLPPSYSETKQKYPVLYLLHSWGEDHNSWLSSQYSQGFHIQKSMDSLINLGAILEMIIVAPDCSNVYGGSWYTNSKSGGNWEDFIIDELVVNVDKLYRTKSNSKFRGIAGHSMGGYGALRMVMNHAKVFGSVYAMSSVNLTSDMLATIKYPDLLKEIGRGTSVEDMSLFSKVLLSKSIAFLPSENQPFYCDYLFILEEPRLKLDSSALIKWNQQLLVNKIKKSVKRIRNLNIVLDHGSKDMLMSQSREFVAALKLEGIRAKFIEYDGGHTDKFRTRVESEMLPFFSDIFKNH